MPSQVLPPLSLQVRALTGAWGLLPRSSVRQTVLSVYKGCRPTADNLHGYASLMTFMLADAVGSLVEFILEKFGPPPPPLAMRAQEVSDALARARALMEELQAVVQARMDLMNSLAAQTEDAERRSKEAILQGQPRRTTRSDLRRPHFGLARAGGLADARVDPGW